MRRFLIALVLLIGPLAGQAAAACPTVCVVVITGSTYTATAAYTTYEWTGTATGRVETIGTSCAGSNSALIITKDGVGNAGINPIAIYSSSGTDTIDGVAYSASSPLMLNTPFQAITLQCDGAGNWMIE